MGVPALFRWLSQKYPKIISAVTEEKPREIDGEEVPVDYTQPNPNGEVDNLYLDMNGIVHPCSHPEDKPPPETEADMMLEVFKYTERVVRMARPRKVLMIAIDGVAPRAKMNQQRSRRFRTAQEKAEKDAEKEEFLKLLKRQNGGVLPDEARENLEKKQWDSNAITPGTPFMGILAASLRYWTAYKLNTDPSWAKLKIIISDATVPGEGEHKIMEFVRSQRSDPSHDANTSHVIYGLDADLIMLGIATHEPHFRVLREDVFFQESKGRACRICGQQGHLAAQCTGEAKKKEGQFDEKTKMAAEKPFIWLHVSVLREYLAIEMNPPGLPFEFDLERALDDWVFMCFFVGNDFLPHLPSLDIREQGIDTLIAIWRDNVSRMGGYVTRDGHVELDRAQIILEALAKQEDTIFKRRKEVEDRKEASRKRREAEDERRAIQSQPKRQKKLKGDDIPDGYNIPTMSLDQLGKTGKWNPDGSHAKPVNGLTHDMVMQRGATDSANKSAAAVLKERMVSSSLRKVHPDRLLRIKQAQGSSSLKRKASDAGEEEQQQDQQQEQEQEQEQEPGTPGRKSPIPEPPKHKPNADDPPSGDVRLWEEGYADRYYESKFKVSPSDHEFRHKVGRAYAEGLAWVLLYYFQGCPSWTWYYPYHYAPFAADFVDVNSMTIDFKKGKPFRPYEQLMGVMPAASRHTIPPVFHPLMTDEDSPIIEFYPEDFEVDLNGKKWAWQGVAILPFIDEKRLLEAMGTKYPLLTQDEIDRNEPGREALLFSDKHPMYPSLANAFYGKQQDTTKVVLVSRESEGLTGVVEKNEQVLLSGPLIYPGDTGKLPDLDEDHSMSVFYEIPPSRGVHKSMLIRGVQLPAPALDSKDVYDTQQRAMHSGREFSRGGGHHRFNGGRGRGRGGGYHNDRNGHDNRHGGDRQPPRDPNYNPFAAHVNPSFFPGGVMPPPPGSAPAGFVPPPPPQFAQHGGPPPRHNAPGMNGGFGGSWGGPQSYPPHDGHRAGGSYGSFQGGVDFGNTYDWNRGSGGRGHRGGGGGGGYGRGGGHGRGGGGRR